VGKVARNGEAVPAQMPQVWLPILDRAWISQNKPVRRKPSRIPVPGKEVWRDRTVGGEMMRVTAVGAAVIVALALITIIIIRALAERNNGGQNQSSQ